MAVVSIAPQEAAPGWRAALSLEIARAGARSVMRRARHRGPLRVQRAFHPEPDPAVAHIYILHPPGGVVGGDVLAIEVAVAGGAAALVTTPAAAKLYRHPDRWSRQQVTCRVAPGATLEWLPQETIAFSGCRGQTGLAAEIAPGAGFIGWEVVTLGRPACGELFSDGEVDQRIALTRSGRPLLFERARLGPGGLAAASWGLRGQPVHGTMVAIAPAPAPLDLEPLRALTAGPGNASVTLVEPDVLVARYLGADAGEARDTFERLRAAIRPAWLGRAAVPPRIWAT